MTDRTAHRAKFTDMQWNVLKYVELGMSLTLSCKKAGYAMPIATAARLKKTPHFKEEMEERLERNQVAMKMTRDKVQTMVLDAFQIARDIQDPNAMVRAASEINKMCGFYELERAQIELSNTQQEFIGRLNELSDDELLAMTEQAKTIDPALELLEEEEHLGDIIDAEFDDE